MKKLFTKLAVIALSAMMVLTITPGTLMAEEMPEEYQEPAEQEIPVEIPVEAPAVVSLNGTDYASFAQALSNLQSGDYTLVLKADVVLANPVTVSVPWGATLTLDLAGYTIKLLDPSEDSAGQDCSGSDYTGDGGLFVVKSGTFNITDSDYSEEGKISSSNNAQPAFKVIWDTSNGTYLNLKGGNFVSSSYQNLIALKDDYGSDASLQDGEVVISGGYYNAMQPEQYVVSGKSMTDAGGYYELTDAPVINTYTVTWYDAYNNPIKSTEVTEGNTAYFDGETPVKAADESYTYEFAGWSVDTVNYGITGNTDVFPTYNQIPIVRTYTVTWYDAYNNVLQTATVNEGETVSYSGEAPAKAADDYYTYDFAGWSVDTVNYGVTGDTDVYPTYNQTPITRTYTVTWYDAYNNVLQTATVNEGEPAYFSGENPTKEADADYTYTFDHWDQDTTNVTGDMYVNPVFNATEIVYTYTVTWYDAYGNVFQTATVNKGEAASCSDTPTKEADADYTYTFEKWDQDTGTVTSDMYVNPLFTATPIVHNYYVTFDVQAEGVPAPDGQTVEQGNTAYEPEAPERDGYRFVGWFTDGAETAFDFSTQIYSDLTLYARWQQQFDVSFSTAHGYVPESMRLYAGDLVPRPVPDPTEDGWSFGGWFTDEACTQEYTFDSGIDSNLVLFAKWDEVQPTEYEVSFEVKEDPEKAPEPEFVEEGKTAADPGPVEVEGYKFEGWFEDGAAQAYDFEEPVRGNVALMAVMEAAPAVYNIIFNPGEGTGVMDPATVTIGEQYTLPECTFTAPDDTKEFDKWDKGAAGEAVDITENNTVITALWKEKETQPEPPTVYNIIFNPGEGTGEMASATVTIGDKYTLPECTFTAPDDTKEFDKWDKGAVGEAVDITENNTVITALWKEKETQPEPPAPVTYTVKFDVQNHGAAPPDQTVEAGKTAIRPEKDPEAEGWTFGGWYQEAACTNVYDFAAAVNSSLTVYAKWTQNQPATYTVTFSYNGRGTDPYKTEEVTDGQKVTKPADPTAEGYIFGGWFTDTACTSQFDFNTPIKEYKILYAKWTEAPTVIEAFSVTFYTAHGVTPDGQLVQKNQKVAEPQTPTADGYLFEGWYSDMEYQNKYDFNAPVTQNLTLYAKWSEEPTTVQYFKVSFYTEHGTAPAEQTIEKGYPAVKPADPTAEGYVFGGWYTDKELQKLYDFNTAVTVNMTLFAKWTQLPSQNYVVSFNSNGHGNTPNPQTVTGGQMVQKPADPTATGYTFTGWYVDTACTQAYNFRAAVSSNLTLYAGWAPNRYTIRYDANSGVGTMASTSCVYDAVTILPANAFTRSGYYFVGWNTMADGSGTGIADKAEIRNLTSTNGETVSLYAQWKNIYNVIEGANAKVQKGGQSGITFRVDGDYNKFTGIRIDNNNVAATQYTSWSGSTYVQLHADYVNQMPGGEHTIRFLFTDGSVETKFEVVSGIPKTGDTNNALVWILIAIAALIIIVVIVLILLLRRRRPTDDLGPDPRFDERYDDRYDDGEYEDDSYDESEYEDDRYDDQEDYRDDRSGNRRGR